MIYNLQYEDDRLKLGEYVQKLTEQGAVVDVRKKNPIRSASQNRYLHLILGWFAAEFGYSLEEVKLGIFKQLCNREIFEVEVTNKRGQKVKTMRSTSALDTAEMTTAIDRFRNYSAREAGLYLPSPNETDYLTYIEQQIDKYKEYI